MRTRTSILMLAAAVCLIASGLVIGCSGCAGGASSEVKGGSAELTHSVKTVQPETTERRITIRREAAAANGAAAAAPDVPVKIEPPAADAKPEWGVRVILPER